MTTAGTAVSVKGSLTLIKTLFPLQLAKGLTIVYRGTNDMSDMRGSFSEKEEIPVSYLPSSVSNDRSFNIK